MCASWMWNDLRRDSPALHVLFTFSSSHATGTTAQMNKIDSAGIVRASIAFVLLALSGAIFCGSGYANEELQSGSRYKIIRPMYLVGAYDSLNNRQLSRETARAYLYPMQIYKQSWVAFQSEVPVGTLMTIVAPAPKVWHLPFFANRYFIRLNHDLSRGLDIVLELNNGIEGGLDGLNHELFERYEARVELEK